VTCPFCHPEAERLVASNEHALALGDGYPIAEGHTLVVPKRHAASLFDLSAEEQAAIWALATEVRNHLQAQLSPDGFNIGLNDGEAAGQTIPHAHIHIIPRRRGDVPDPRGGVRWVIPELAAYWTIQ